MAMQFLIRAIYSPGIRGKPGWLSVTGDRSYHAVILSGIPLSTPEAREHGGAVFQSDASLIYLWLVDLGWRVVVAALDKKGRTQ